MRHLEPLRLAVALTGLVLAFPVPAQLGVDLRPDEKASEQPATPDATKRPSPPQQQPGAATPAPVTMPELDVSRGGDAASRIADANRVLARGDYQTAALAYDAILRDPALGEAHDEARYQLAKCLTDLGLNHAALARLDEILSKGPQGTKYYTNALEWLFHVAAKTVNESVIIGVLARHGGGALPPSQQDRYAYLLARYAYERGHALEELGRSAEAKSSYAEAHRLAGLVRPEAGAHATQRQGEVGTGDGDVYARARFVDALVQYASGQSQPAVDELKDVVRLTNPRRGRAPDRRLRELAFLQLARIHYEHKQNRYAIFYYDRMPWGGGSWLEGLWESSYAHYRIGDYEKALGNLLTLQSPYFRDAWFPESWILKAIIYYENCRYPEALSILDDFHANYEGVYAELVKLTERGKQPSAFFDVIEDVEKNRAARPLLMRRILNVALTDRSLRQLNDSILEIERETGSLEAASSGLRAAFRSSPLALEVRDGLQRERRRLVEEAGARTRAKLEYERDSVRELLQQALRIKIEVARNQREALEAELKTGVKPDALRDYRYSVAVSDEHLYWPYDGEFWRDELGTYTYTLTKGCRDTGARAFR